MKYKDYIGVFDSGIGGLTVLKELINVLPNENFIFFGDSLNSPYGDKTKKEILGLSMHIVKYLIDNGVKAIVIACNTATTAAAKEIRKKYPNIPILGIQPAIIPAQKEHPDEKILVMATDTTIRLKNYSTKDNIIPIPCHNLAEAIENDIDVTYLLNRYLLPYKNKSSVIVLGCTHYPYIKENIEKVLGKVIFYDGAHATALNLKRQLEKKNKLNSSKNKGKVIFESSNKREKRYKGFLDKYNID